MRTLALFLVVVVALSIGAFVLVARRDRSRLPSADDSTAARDARSEQERQAAERHGTQGAVWQRGDQTGR